MLTTPRTTPIPAPRDPDADVNRASEGTHTSPLLIATMNGHFDLAMELLEEGADPNVGNAPAAVTPLYAAIMGNVRNWRGA